jgi:hypothetical protein
MARDRRPALLKVFKQQPNVVVPEDWFNASIQIVWIEVLMSWIIIFIFKAEFIHENVLLQRLGYTPIGAAMVSAPAVYPAAAFFSVAMYCHARYCHTDNVRCQLSDASLMMKKLVYRANAVETICWMAFPLVFVLTPEKDALTSCFAFFCLVVGNFLGMAMNFYEIDNKYHRKGSWVYLFLLGLVTISFPTCVIIQLASYNEQADEVGPVPVWLCGILDFGWFAMLTVQTRFVPAAPSLEYECVIVEDKDFQNENLRRSVTSEEAVAKDKPQKFGLLRILRSPPDVVSPETWFSASSEVMTVCFIVSWTITSIFNPDLISDNALMERLGYNNICVAWDAPPALYPASIIFSLALYCQLRFCYLDNLRCVLSDASASQKWWTQAANLVQGGSWCVFPIVYVMTPDQNALIHSGAFVCLIIGNLFGMATNFYEMDNQYHKKGSWIYLACLTFFSIGFPGVVVTQLLTYREDSEELGPAPVWLNVFLDYGWFLCLAIQSRFMPAAPSIYFKCKLVEDEDFKFDTAKVAPDPAYNSITPAVADETGKSNGWCKRDSSAIICPVLATLYNQGDLEVDQHGCCTREQLMKGLMKTGCSGTLLKVLTLPASKGPLNIFELKQNKAVAHKVSSCIRNPQPDEGALHKFFDEYVTDVITAKELGKAWSTMSNDPELAAKSNPEGKPLMIAVWAAMLEAFGRTDAGGLYLTKEDVHGLYIDLKYPKDWQPHKYGSFTIVKRVRQLMKSGKAAATQKGQS